MAAYPTSLVPQLNKVPEDAEGGQITPSHGGMIGGHEFDMSIAEPTFPTQPLPSQRTETTPQPVPRYPQSQRPRPMSMPPQAYNTGTPTAGGPSPATSSSETRDRSQMAADEPTSSRRQHRDAGNSSNSRPSRSNRILGDYTLSKTLGAGSMGKVKLATHNITGEKVRDSL